MVKSLLSMRVKLRDDFLFPARPASLPAAGTEQGRRSRDDLLPGVLTGPAWYQLPLAVHISIVGVLSDLGDLIHTHPFQGGYIVIPDIESTLRPAEAVRGANHKDAFNHLIRLPEFIKKI